MIRRSWKKNLEQSLCENDNQAFYKLLKENENLLVPNHPQCSENIIRSIL